MQFHKLQSHSNCCNVKLCVVILIKFHALQEFLLKVHEARHNYLIIHSDQQSIQLSNLSIYLPCNYNLNPKSLSIYFQQMLAIVFPNLKVIGSQHSKSEFKLTSFSLMNLTQFSRSLVKALMSRVIENANDVIIKYSLIRNLLMVHLNKDLKK